MAGTVSLGLQASPLDGGLSPRNGDYHDTCKSKRSSKIQQLLETFESSAQLNIPTIPPTRLKQSNSNKDPASKREEIASALDQARQEFQHEKSLLETQINDNQEQLKAERKANQKLRKANEKLQQEIEKLKDQIKEADAHENLSRERAKSESVEAEPSISKEEEPDSSKHDFQALMDEINRLRDVNRDSLSVIGEYEEVTTKQSQEIDQLKQQLLQVLHMGETLQTQITEERTARANTEEQLQSLQAVVTNPSIRSFSYPTDDAHGHDNIINNNHNLDNSFFRDAAKTNKEELLTGTVARGHEKKRKAAKQKRGILRKFGKSQTKLNDADDIILHSPRDSFHEFNTSNNNVQNNKHINNHHQKRESVSDSGQSRSNDMHHITSNNNNNNNNSINNNNNNNRTNFADPQPMAMSAEQMRKELEVLVILGEKLQDELTREKKNHQKTKQQLAELEATAAAVSDQAGTHKNLKISAIIRRKDRAQKLEKEVDSPNVLASPSSPRLVLSDDENQFADDERLNPFDSLELFSITHTLRDVLGFTDYLISSLDRGALVDPLD